jgi:hypothetical protein
MKIKCFLGFHELKEIDRQTTKEINDISGCHFKRIVYECKVCNKIVYKNNDHMLFSNPNETSCRTWVSDYSNKIIKRNETIQKILD